MRSAKAIDETLNQGHSPPMGDYNRLDPATHKWLQGAALQRIMAAIKAGGGEARVVGGAVRDALLGRAVGEIDFACNLPPDKCAELLSKEGIKVVPTGIDHGTITAVVDSKGYEITTLRHDVETDGRRAKVSFTDDWQADAARRDFTFNALYADGNGRIYDYFGGRVDLDAGRVRFIGDAKARIKEDVLRILRYFRFQAWFGKETPMAEALSACHDLASLLPTLSMERVWRETLKLLSAENPVPAWKLMKDNDVLVQILPEATNIARLENLMAVEKKYRAEPSALVRFAALLPKNLQEITGITKKLKLSNREAEKLKVLATLPDHLRGKLDPVPFRKALYEYDAENTADAALLLAADDKSDITYALGNAARWERPEFPVYGEDILKLGIPSGPKVGVILKAVEEWWMEKDFRPTRSECLEETKKRAG